MLITINPLCRLTAKLCAICAGFIKPFSVRQAKTSLVGHHIISAVGQGKANFIILPRQMLTLILILRCRGNVLVKTAFIFFLFREIEAEFYLHPVFLRSCETAVDKIMS